MVISISSCRFYSQGIDKPVTSFTSLISLAGLCLGCQMYSLKLTSTSSDWASKTLQSGLHSWVIFNGDLPEGLEHQSPNSASAPNSCYLKNKLLL